MASGAARGCVALLTDDGNPPAPSVQAHGSGDAWQVTGTLDWVINAGAADLLVLNKLDLADDPAVLRCWLSTHSAAPVLEARHADVPLDLLFGLDRHGEPAGEGVADGFASWSYEWPEPVERETLLAMLRDAVGVLRAKGIVRFADAPGRCAIVHMVGRRIDVSEAGPWCDTDSSRLVLLGVRSMLEFAPRERNNDGTS